MVNQRLIILMLIILGQAACGPSGNAQKAGPTSTGLEFRVVLDEARCRSDCEVIEFESMLQGKTVLRVSTHPDLVLSKRDIESFAPLKLSAVSADRPDAVVWRGRLKLTSEASTRVRRLANRLAKDDKILISAGGQPLDVSYPRLVGQNMGVGQFSSRNELVEILGRYAKVAKGMDEDIEVFSPEELAAKRQRSEVLNRSEKMLRETEEIRKLADEGKISRTEMIERLAKLTGEASEE